MSGARVSAPRLSSLIFFHPWLSDLCLAKLAVDAGPSYSPTTPANARVQGLRAISTLLRFGAIERFRYESLRCLV